MARRQRVIIRTDAFRWFLKATLGFLVLAVIAAVALLIWLLFFARQFGAASRAYRRGYSSSISGVIPAGFGLKVWWRLATSREKCRLCKTRSVDVARHWKDRLWDHFELKCENCGQLFTHKQPRGILWGQAAKIDKDKAGLHGRY